MDKMYAQQEMAVVNPLIFPKGKAVAGQENMIPAGYTVSNPGIALRKKWNQVFKRSSDITIALIVIVCILSWLIPLLAILIKLNSKGPVFFLQLRNKCRSEHFTCIKFRTMLVNAEAHQLASWENDKRITRLGRFLRNHYLDELPQFINVLVGDMSVIGPRPHMLSETLEFEQRVHNYTLRHHVKPGITGLAQVMGYAGPVSNLHSIRSRVKLDLFYIRNWSPKLDMLIYYRSIFKILGI